MPTLPAASVRASLALAAALGLATIASGQVSINFNSDATSFTDNFTRVSVGTGTQPSWGASAGIDNTGGVTFGSEDSAYRYNNATFDPSAGAITLSAMFKLGTIAGATVGYLGIQASDTTNPVTNGEWIGVQIRNQGTTTDNDVFLRTAYNNAQVGSQSSNFITTSGNWYLLTAVITRSATTNEFTVTGSLTDYGASGTVSGTSLSLGEQTATSSALWNDTTVYAAFRGRSGNGTVAIDNFAVSSIPEPSAFAALAGLGALGLAASRRRSRA